VETSWFQTIKIVKHEEGQEETLLLARPKIVLINLGAKFQPQLRAEKLTELCIAVSAQPWFCIRHGLGNSLQHSIIAKDHGMLHIKVMAVLAADICLDELVNILPQLPDLEVVTKMMQWKCCCGTYLQLLPAGIVAIVQKIGKGGCCEWFQFDSAARLGALLELFTILKQAIKIVTFSIATA